jgi:peptidoglycan/xylan/chitin deacetylase (PgdA/CDA1 family)
MLHLLVGIDTESDNQWDLASRERPTFENLYALPALHALFRRHGVRPTYVITWPVAKDPRSADVLRELRESHTCEIGAHHHAWETPPCEPDDMRRHPYAADLPSAQFEAQLTALTDAIADAVGERPVSYRSGRFGFSAAHVAPLERAGYRVESSVTPLFYEGHKGGPDFADATLRPYYLSYDHATRPGTSQLLELPLSSALDRRVPHALAMAYARAPRNYDTKRILRKLGIARVLWLRPSYSSLDDMVRLARRVADEGEPLLNLLFHSSEAIVGGSPYNRTQAELDAFLDRLDRFLAFATRELKAEPLTFIEFRDRYVAPQTMQRA